MTNYTRGDDTLRSVGKVQISASMQMAHLFRVRDVADLVHHVVRGPALGLVDYDDSVQCCPSSKINATLATAPSKAVKLFARERNWQAKAPAHLYSQMSCRWWRRRFRLRTALFHSREQLPDEWQGHEQLLRPSLGAFARRAEVAEREITVPVESVHKRQNQRRGDQQHRGRKEQ